MNLNNYITVDAVFKYSLIFSLFFHTAIIIEWPFYKHLFTQQNQYKAIEVTYLKFKETDMPTLKREVIREPAQSKIEIFQPTKIASERLSKSAQPQKSELQSAKKDGALPSEKKKEGKDEKGQIVEQKPSTETGRTSAQKPEGVASIDLKGLRPVPASYSQAVRNKIRKNIGGARSEIEGDVYVRFVVTSDGKLKELSIIDERSTKNRLLKEKVFEAIKNSSPFPNFPKEFVSPEVVFTCQISFELK